MNRAKGSPDCKRCFAKRRIISAVLYLMLASVFAGCNEKPDQPPVIDVKITPQMFLEELADENALFRWSLDLEATTSVDLYSPEVNDFKLPYNNDNRNQDKQTWQEYADFIPQFYDGTMFIGGWDKQASERISDLKSKKVYLLFNVIGRVIAAEWAKDNSVRKISTTDLYAFAGDLTATGTEDELLEQLQALAIVVKGKLSE